MKRGVTLVELLVVTSLLTMVAGSVLGTVSGGMTVWERVYSHGKRAQWTQVTFDQFQRDLSSMRPCKLIAFRGEYDAIEFAAALDDPNAEADTPSAELGRLGYYFDGGRRRLCRSAHPYRQARRYRLKDACQPVLEEIERVRFAYYTRDLQSETYEWRGSWDGDELPRAVRLEIGYRAPDSRDTVTRTLVAKIPVGGGQLVENDNAQ